MILFLFARFLFASANPIAAGDLLFQDLNCGPMCDAIAEVTEGHDGHRFSHVAIALDEKQAIEAIGKEVSVVRISDFLKRSKDQSDRPKVAVGKLDLSKNEREKILRSAVEKLLTPYDIYFDLGNDKLYCSELVYFTYEKGVPEKPIFKLNKMTFKKKNQDVFFPVWEKYFAKLNTPIPEGDLGINPGAISRSEFVKMTYPFYP